VEFSVFRSHFVVYLLRNGWPISDLLQLEMFSLLCVHVIHVVINVTVAVARKILNLSCTRFVSVYFRFGDH